MDLTDNEISALRAIYSLETPTRMAISRECSMGLGVTSSVLGSLLRKGAIGKIDKYTPTMGHPSAIFGIDAAFGFTIGIVVDTASVRIVAVDASKALVAESLVPVDVMSAEAGAIGRAGDSPLMKGDRLHPPCGFRNKVHGLGRHDSPRGADDVFQGSGTDDDAAHRHRLRCRGGSR